MTVEVGRKTINLGWETAVAIVLFLITTTFIAGTYWTNSENERNKNKQDIADIKAGQKEILSRLSKVDNIGQRVDSLVKIHSIQPRQRTAGQRFVYEIVDKNGQTILKPVK